MEPGLAISTKCEGFVKRLYLAAAEAGASVAVPLYDRGFPQQIAYTGPASAFVPTKRYDPAHWMDGTCMLVTSEACDQLGYLDAEHFGRYGWGASLDYRIRARRRGLRTVLTHQAYLNHLEAVTAHAVLTDYESNAEQEREEGMRLKYGAAWRAQLTSNPAKKLMYMALQRPAARAFARSIARTRVGRELAGHIR